MSATVYWRPIKGGKVLGKIEVRELLEKAFGDFPITLNEAHVNDLGMLSRVTDSAEVRDKLEALRTAIDTHGAIEVYLEY